MLRKKETKRKTFRAVNNESPNVRTDAIHEFCITDTASLRESCIRR